MSDEDLPEKMMNAARAARLKIDILEREVALLEKMLFQMTEHRDAWKLAYKSPHLDAVPDDELAWEQRDVN